MSPTSTASGRPGWVVCRVSAASAYIRPAIGRRNLDVRPTIEVRPGYELNVEVTADLDLPGPYEQAAAY